MERQKTSAKWQKFFSLVIRIGFDIEKLFRVLNPLLRRRISPLEGIIDAEKGILILAEAMVRKDFHSPDVVELGKEIMGFL